jgi:hypothetical protein
MPDSKESIAFQKRMIAEFQRRHAIYQQTLRALAMVAAGTSEAGEAERLRTLLAPEGWRGRLLELLGPPTRPVPTAVGDDLALIPSEPGEDLTARPSEPGEDPAPRSLASLLNAVRLRKGIIHNLGVRYEEPRPITFRMGEGPNLGSSSAPDAPLRVERYVANHVQHHLLYQLARFARFSDAGDPFARWSAWVEREIFAYYDALILEALDQHVKPQDASGSAFLTSLEAARRHHEVPALAVNPEAVDDPCDPGHPDHHGRAKHARDELAHRLDHATPEAARELLGHFVSNWAMVIAAADDLIHDTKSISEWVINLFGRPAAGSVVTQEILRALLKFDAITGQPWWFLRTSMIRRVVRAEAQIRWLERPVAARMADRANAPMPEGPGRRLVKIIDDARRVFIEGCQRLLQDPPVDHAGIVFDSNHRHADKIDLATSCANRRTAEDLWWSALGGDAGAVAAFCYGEQYADWNVPTRTAGDAGAPPEDPAVAHERIVCVRLPVHKPEGAPTRRGAVVFGGGIAGLTAAHELAVRGFKVRVVEAVSSTKRAAELGGVQVGGFARTHWSSPAPEVGATDPKAPLRVATDPKAPLRVATTPSTTPGPERLFPGEHGYRFFPSFYRHIFDTMKRTPQGDGEQDWAYPTAFDQLQPTYQQVFARRSKFVPLSRGRTRSLESFRKEYMQLVHGLDFERRDITRFFFRLVRYLMTCKARRSAEYERQSFLEFLGGAEFYSPKFVEAIKAAPQALVAMDAEQCDARTQGNIYLQLLMDQVLGGEYTDATLRGPTSRVWLDPWQGYLKNHLSVEFLNATLLSLSDDEDGALKAVLELPSGDCTLRGAVKTAIEAADYVVVALDSVAAERVTSHWKSGGVPSELHGFASYVNMELPAGLDRFDVSLPFKAPQPRAEADMELRRMLALIRDIQEDTVPDTSTLSAFRSVSHVTGELLMFGDEVAELRISLWCQRKIGPREVALIERTILEMSAVHCDVRLNNPQPEWVDKASMVRTPRLPEDHYGQTPKDRFQTFTGIQYYFEQDFQLVRGHVYFPDTDWGLSAVSQSQFWREPLVDPRDPERRLRGVLSVDIGDCRKRSSYTHKSLVESTPEEIQAEVWRQVTESLMSVRGATSVVTNLPLPRPRYYHLDQNLQFVGGELRANKTPFLINNIGDWEQRPRCMPWMPGQQVDLEAPRTDAPGVWQAAHGGYRIHADKVVFCGHYMRTFTRMTTMEAANESARHAVNAILSHLAWAHGSLDSRLEPVSGDYCQIWDLEQNELEDLDFFKRIDERLFKAGKPHIADILQFDKIADLQHPELSPMQALLTALGAQIGKDWGIQPQEIVGSVRGLLDVARRLGEQLGGGVVGGGSTMQRLMSLLNGKSGGSEQ